MATPNFLIVGAAKAGTTSLYAWLCQHPGVFMPEMKEPSFFLHKYGLSDWQQYVSLFNLGEGRIAIGEASAGYLAAPESPEWIYNVLGDIKIIILLRSPAQRAFSLYSWMVMEGYEWLFPFEKALTAEEKRFCDAAFPDCAPQYYWDYFYFNSSLYYEQVKRYIQVFGRERVKIFLFEDLVDNAQEVYQASCRFLGLPKEDNPLLSAKNASRIPRSEGLQYEYRKLQILSHRLPYPFSSAVRYFSHWGMQANVRLGHKPKMKPETKLMLQQKFQMDIAHLSQLIQRDLTHWQS